MGTCGLALTFLGMFLAFLSIFSKYMGENQLVAYYGPSTFETSFDRHVIFKTNWVSIKAWGQKVCDNHTQPHKFKVKM